MKETLLKLKLEIETEIDKMDGNEKFDKKYQKGYIEALVNLKESIMWELRALNN
jgi:hypothetical protein